jgi:hypothetical protein
MVVSSLARRNQAMRVMSRADQYRALASQCLQWARDATTDELRAAYLDLERQWLDEASFLDRRPPVRSPVGTSQGPSRKSIPDIPPAAMNLRSR